MKQVKVSILMPAYNAEDYVATCIHSILAQDFMDWELIVIDDFSTDTTFQILQTFVRQDKRIQLFRNQSKGIIPALALAFTRAKGQFITRMDADDIAHPTRQEKQLAYLEQTGADICGCWIRFFGDRQGEWRMPIDDAAIRTYLMFNSPLAHPTVMARTHLMQAHPYDPANQHAEDYGLWCTLALAGAKFANVPEVLLDYRTHAGQITQSRAEALRAAAQQSRARYIPAALPPALQSVAPRLTELAEPGRVLSVEECHWLFVFLLRLHKDIATNGGLGILWLDALQRTPDAGLKLVLLSRLMQRHYPLPGSETARYRRMVARCLMGKWLRDRLRK